MGAAEGNCDLLHDISPPIRPTLAVWPGDTPPRREVLCDLARGDTVTLSSLHATVHLGAHADAPSHYGRGAPCIASRDLDLYLGRCEVVRVDVGREQRIGSRHFDRAPRAPRVLFRTGTFPHSETFSNDFAAIEPELMTRLAGAGVRLIGIDTPSVDLFASKDLPAHAAALAHDLAILEGLVLEGVSEGLYELIALPLRLVDFDASPVRAVLRTLEP